MNRAFLLAYFLLSASRRSQALLFLLLLALPLNGPLRAQQGAQLGCTQNCGQDPSRPRNQQGGPDQRSVPPPDSPTLHSHENDESAEMMVHINQVQLQKDSMTLGELCASVSAQMNAVQRGALPKDVVENLKSVEKLSKRVREELTRYTQANQPTPTETRPSR
jgi:hypothetical protein